MNFKNKPFYYYSLLPTLVACIIFYLSCLIKPNNIPDVSFDFFIPMDKLTHFCMYFGLSITIGFNYIFVNKGHIVILRLIIWGILLPIVYGGVIEILQGKYFDRSTELWDFIANSLGAIASLPFSLYLRKIFLKKYRSHNIF